jgi:hypothetical protein
MTRSGHSESPDGNLPTDGEDIMRIRSIALAVVAAAAMFATTAIAQTRLATEEMIVKSPDPGIEIYVRNKHPADMAA